jgi:hypothetical protein
MTRRRAEMGAQGKDQAKTLLAREIKACEAALNFLA